MKLLDKLLNKKPEPKTSLGWVNVYNRGDGTIMISQVPKPTHHEATKSRKGLPKNEYVGTVEIFSR